MPGAGLFNNFEAGKIGTERAKGIRRLAFAGLSSMKASIEFSSPVKWTKFVCGWEAPRM